MYTLDTKIKEKWGNQRNRLNQETNSVNTNS
jgi:hypothetical protein